MRSSAAIWKVATVFAILVSFYGIADNGASIEDVCEHAQRTDERIARTLETSLKGQIMIRDDPVEAQRTRVPGFDYYIAHPEELETAIKRTRAELRIYQTHVC